MQLIRVLACACLLFAAVPAWAATYYVRTDGSNANTGLANTAGGAWLTITFATDNVTAGDTIRVQAGNYVETASPSDNGTSGNTVTIVADGVVRTCGMTFSSNSYIRTIGFKFDGTLGGCTLLTQRIRILGTNTGLEFWNNTITNGDFGIRMENSTITCNACIFFGGEISEIDNNTYGLVLNGTDSYAGYINFSNIIWLGVNPAGERHRFVNLNFSGFDAISGAHPDFFFVAVNTHGFSNNLIESVYGEGNPTLSDMKFIHANNSSALFSPWTDNIIRFSVSYNLGSGVYSQYANNDDNTNFHYYHNTITFCARALTGALNDVCGNFSGLTGNVGSATIRNTIFYQAWADDATAPATIDVWHETVGINTVTANYNLAFDPDASQTFGANWNAQANEQSNVDPVFVSSPTDFRLQSGSGARGVGGPMTLAVGAAGGGSSTSLTVTAGTGGMFVGDNSANLPAYGGALVPGDIITVGSTTVQVASRAGDVLTLASAINWANGDPVYYGTSSTIDIGAYPYKAGGYTLTATYANSGGTTTITPSDASLVRFAVCYNDSVPVTIDNSSPYTCATPAGALTVRVYPRYASASLFAEAVEAAASSVGPIRRRRVKPSP